MLPDTRRGRARPGTSGWAMPPTRPMWRCHGVPGTRLVCADAVAWGTGCLSTAEPTSTARPALLVEQQEGVPQRSEAGQDMRLEPAHQDVCSGHTQELPVHDHRQVKSAGTARSRERRRRDPRRAAYRCGGASNRRCGVVVRSRRLRALRSGRAPGPGHCSGPIRHHCQPSAPLVRCCRARSRRDRRRAAPRLSSARAESSSPGNGRRALGSTGFGSFEPS